MPPRKRLGQLLTELHVVDEHQLQSALGHQKQWGGKLGAILVQKGFCREEQVVSALATHLGMPVVKLSTQKVDPRAVKLVARPIAEKLHVFAYEITGSGRGEVVTIAMSDPTDLSAVDQLAFHTGKRIKPMLCGDSEIVSAISSHYGEAHPAPPAAGTPKPAAAPAPSATAPAPATPSATSIFPKRIEPNPPGGPPRSPAPWVPPPIPSHPPEASQPLDEIEPVDADALANVAAPRADPLDLPESDSPADGPMEGLEPIAAHSQGSSEEVAGQEEVAGDGSAADALEGLEDAGTAMQHAGVEAAPLDGLEGSDAPPVSWDSAPAAESSEWGAAPAGGWDAEGAPAQEAPPADAGWGEAAAPPEPAPEPAPAEGEFGQAQDWTETPGTPDPAWEGAQPESAVGEQPAAEEPPSEELPADAIIGTADALEGGDAEAWAAAAGEQGEPAGESQAEEQDAAPGVTHGEQAAPQHGEAHEAEAPDAWATSEDPLAAGEQGASASAWAEAAPEPSAEAAPEPLTGPEPSAEAAPEPSAGAEPEPHAGEAWADGQQEWASDQPQDEAHPHEHPSEGEQAAASETEAGWPAEAAGEGAAGTQEGAQKPAGEGLSLEGEHALAGHEPTQEQAVPPEHSFVDPEPAQEHAAQDEHAFADPGQAQEHAPAAQEEAPAGNDFASFEDAAAPERSASPGEAPAEESLVAGWVAPPPEPPAVGAGWLGEALASTAPLSPSDLETLSAVGVDVNDGVGAFRLLAAVLRVLQRRNAIDFDELAGELAQSRNVAPAGAGAAAEP